MSWPLTSSLRGRERVRVMRLGWVERPRERRAVLRSSALAAVRYSLRIMSYWVC